MKKQYILLIGLLLLVGMSTQAEETRAEETTAAAAQVAQREEGGIFRGYSGGMMLHLGYQYGTNTGFAEGDNQPFLRSITYGIGGAMRFHLMRHLRIGAEGFVSTMPLKSQGEGSNIRAGWGGVLADFYVTLGKFQPFIGGTIGGGAQRATHVFRGESQDLTWKERWEQFKGYANSEETYPAEFTKAGFFALDPFIGFEYALTNRMHLLVRADWLLAIHRQSFLTPTGPRLYVGFMFTH